MFLKSKIVLTFMFIFLTHFDSIGQGIFSAKAYLLTDEFGGTTRFFSCGTNGTCDPNWTSNWDGVTVSTITVGSTFGFGGNLITFENWTNWSNAALYYRIYLEGALPGGFTAIPLSQTTNNICSNVDNAKRETINTPEIITAPAEEGIYIFEIYFQARYNPNNTDYFFSNLSNNYRARLNVIQPIASFESYAFVNLNGSQTFYDLDGAFGSANPGLPNFLGTFQPGLAFRLGAEQKIYKKAPNYEVCECSSWYYFYEDDPLLDPVQSDFPLPATSTDFTSGFNGLFKKSSILPQLIGTFDAVGTTDSFDYNTVLNSSTTIEKYQNTSVGLDAEIIFPNCIGRYRIAITLLTKYSVIGDCSNVSSLRYLRDNNQAPIFRFNNSSSVNLNPKKPVNSLSNNDFYITSVEVFDTNAPEWNGVLGGGWSVTPDKGSNVVFNEDYQTALHGDLVVNTVTIDTGVTVTVSNGGHIECFNNAVTNGTGKIIVQNQGNFVQRCGRSTIIRPYIEMEKISRPMSDWDYVYWGVPVSENIYSQIPALLDRRYRWQSGTATGAWQNFGTTVPGEGFITRIPNSAPFNTTPTVVNFTMRGTANNGSVFLNVDSFDSFSMIYGNAVLLANPYPCAIDAATFLDHPNNTELGGTLSFWTSFTPISDLTPGPNTYNYDEADYATWNRTGGTGIKASSDTTGNDSLRPTGIIASGQGFFVHAFADGPIEFDNSMRLVPNVNTQFFRTAQNTILNQEQEKSRFWLNFKDEQAGFRQMLVGYVANATNGIDRNFDGSSVTTSSIDVYTVLGDKKLNIQGRALPFQTTEVLPLGYRVGEQGTFTFFMDSFDGLFNEQAIYIKDNLLNVTHSLKVAPYVFISDAGVFENRFEIIFQDDSVLGVNLPLSLENSILITTKDVVAIKSSEMMESLQIYDLLGRKVFEKNEINSNEIVLKEFSKSNQVYIVKIKTSVAEISKKMVY
jgi:hypothetical protein